MVGNSKSCPVMDNIGLYLKDIKSCLDMCWMVSDLDLHSCNIFQELNVIWLESICVLETFGRFEIISFLFINGSHRVPTKHTFHFAFHQTYFCCLKRFILFSQAKFKQRLHRDCFRMIRMSFQQLLCVFKSFFIVFRVMEFLILLDWVQLIVEKLERLFEVDFIQLCSAWLMMIK